MANLSPTMQDAVEFARQHGNKLIRLPGGFWCREGLTRWERPWFGTTTVEALVKRGVAEYTKWQEGRSRFPIEMTLKETAD